jgi:hypothetical protein
LNSRSLRWHKRRDVPSLASDPTRFAKFSSFHSPAKGVEGRVFPSSIVPVQAGMKQEPQSLSEPITSHYGPFMSLPLPP